MTDWMRKIWAHLKDPLAGAGLDPRKADSATRWRAQQLGLPNSAVNAQATGPSAATGQLVLPLLSAPGVSPSDTALEFKHPWSGQATDLTFPKAEEIGRLLDQSLPRCATEDWRTQFWLLWRLWPAACAARTASLAYLPADCRAPHTASWHQRSVASALAGLRDPTNSAPPACLLFQFERGRDFITQARRPQDLWSGGFLGSWLLAQSLQTLSEELGPDVIVYPALRGHPLFDWLNRDKLKLALAAAGDPAQTAWDELALEAHSDRVLTSSLPDHFLAVVPADFNAGQLAQRIEEEWQAIAASCWQYLEARCPLSAEQKIRWDFQIGRGLEITWQLWPWQEAAAALADLETIPSRTKAALDLGEKMAFAIPAAQRDPNDYPGGLLDSSWAWSAHCQLAAHRLAARRQTCDFAAWQAPHGLPQAVLSGPAEVITDAAWLTRAQGHRDLETLFGPEDMLGAIHLVTRVWPQAWLAMSWSADIPVGFAGIRSQGSVHPERSAREGTAYALLALRGDHLGDWLEDVATPAIQAVLAPACVDYLKQHGPQAEDWLRQPHPLTPAYHLQLTEALANFGLYGVQRIVSHHRGQLIFAYGDEVLAWLPAEEAIACARGLRLAFQGAPQLAAVYPGRFANTHPGFLCVHAEVRQPADPGWPVVVPGPAATLSAGIALGPVRAPLPAMVCAAWAALQRAQAAPIKTVFDRETGLNLILPAEGLGGDALAVTLYRPHATSVHWGAPWNSPALALGELLQRHSGSQPGIAPGFPQQLATILSRYDIQAPLTEERAGIAARELAWVLGQQAPGLAANEQQELLRLGTEYLNHLWQFQWHDAGALHPAPRPLAEFMNLFSVAAWIPHPGD